MTLVRIDQGHFLGYLSLMPVKLKKSERTRSKIFSIAMQLFQKHGFDCISVEEITRKAEVAKGTFFSHFPTKDAVLAEIGEVLYLYILGKLEGKSFANEKEKLESIFHFMGEWHQKNRKLSALVTRLMLGNPTSQEAGRLGRKKGTGIIVEIIRKGQKGGEFKKSFSAEIAAQTLMGAYFFHLVEWHLGDLNLPFSKVVDTSTAIILEGIRQ